MEKNGEYLTFEGLNITSIDWYTKGNHDCSLDVSNGTHEYNHSDGSVWQKYTIEDGKPNGEWKIYHANGEVNVERYYENGKYSTIMVNYGIQSRIKMIRNMDIVKI